MTGKLFDVTLYFIALGLAWFLFRRKKLSRVLLFLFAAAVVAEVFFMWFLRDPALRDFVLRKPRMFVSRVYAMQQRNTDDPARSRYDEELGYTLKPGDWAFNGAEFSTNVHINSLGLRDDEGSLAAPAVIAVGDSFAMGWGVQQEETFPQIVEKRSGLKALNAGIASYGTVREMSLLKRLDLSGLKYLVIQYCLNDDDENKSYGIGGNRLAPMPREDYQKRLRVHRAIMRYFPGKHAADLLLVAYQEVRKAAVMFFEGDPNEGSARFFLNAFKHAAPWENMDTRDLRVMVLVVGGGPQLCKDILNGMRGSEKYPIPADHMACENGIFAGHTPPLQYPLDLHWNAKGHEEVASLVLDWIKNSRQADDDLLPSKTRLP